MSTSPSWTRILTTNLKLVAVGGVAVLVAGTGAAATTLTLTGSQSDLPDPVVASASPSPSAVTPVTGDVSSSDTPTVGIEPTDSPDGRDSHDSTDSPDGAVTPSASPSDTATVGIRPTDTHGFCVSHAVHAVTAPAAGGRGADTSAAAHSCPKPHHRASPTRRGHGRPTHPRHASHGHGRAAGQSATSDTATRTDRPRGKSGAHQH